MPAAGPRLTGINLAGLVGQAAGRTALPLILTKATERGAGECWDPSHSPVLPVMVFPSIAHTSYWESQQTDIRHGLNSQLQFCCKKHF